MDTSLGGILSLADWRRRVAELYARVRGDPDPERAWRSWCEVRHDLFVGHPSSPIPQDDRAGYEGPFMFPYDPAARVTAELRPAPEETFEIANNDGAVTRFTRFAHAVFELHGQRDALETLWLDAYGGGIYLAFRDATSGSATYGGGRYLIDTVKGADLGRDGEGLVLDFNFSYQPSCSYDARWSCPLPPPANHLGFEVAAGERLGSRTRADSDLDAVVIGSGDGEGRAFGGTPVPGHERMVDPDQQQRPPAAEIR